MTFTPLATLPSPRNFILGAQVMREMQARFVEQGGSPTDHAIAASIRANWNPAWGPDPGPPSDALYDRMTGRSLASPMPEG